MTTRRTFIQHNAMALGALLLTNKIPSLTAAPRRLSFSTIGCPAWTFPDIVSFAASNGYKGIEFRGINGELDLTRCAAFGSDQIKNSIRLMADHRLAFADLGSSAEMHHAEAPIRTKNMDEGKRYIDLAHALGCENIRVFPNNLPKGDERAATIDRIIGGLQELGDYASTSGVHVLMESHGDCVQADELADIMQQTNRATVGMVWDVCNMWVETKEAPSVVYPKLKKYIRHAHIKDLTLTDGKIRYVEMGTGESPIKEAIRILDKDGYKGFYSFEWEKLWHPELEAPEIALAHFPAQIESMF